MKMRKLRTIIFAVIIMICVVHPAIAFDRFDFDRLVGDSLIRITDEFGDNPFHHEFVRTNFNIGHERQRGATHFRIDVEFEVQEIDDGWVDVEIWMGHSLRGFRVGTRGRFDPPSNRHWVRFTHRVDVPIDVFNNQFTIQWSAAGWGRDDYHLRARHVRVHPFRAIN